MPISWKYFDVFGTRYMPVGRGARQLDIAKTLSNPPWGLEKISTKNSDRDARVTFLGLNFDNLLFLGVLKIRVIFWGG